MTAEPEKVNHPIFARIYMRMSKRAGGPEAEHRRELLRGLSGRVVEVGAGNGLNFFHYPSAVEKVVAVEPEPLLRQAAREAAEQVTTNVDVVEGVAAELPLEDESCDAGVASLVLCSVADQSRALAELNRVIKPGGELRFYEHVVSRKPISARLMRLADATFWPRVAGGCHMSRDTASAVEAAGFDLEQARRFPFTPGFPVPPIPHVLGIARRPPSITAPPVS